MAFYSDTTSVSHHAGVRRATELLQQCGMWISGLAGALAARLTSSTEPQWDPETEQMREPGPGAISNLVKHHPFVLTSTRSHRS